VWGKQQEEETGATRSGEQAAKGSRMKGGDPEDGEKGLWRPDGTNLAAIISICGAGKGMRPPWVAVAAKSGWGGNGDVGFLSL
jgi:hypothetical protein